MQGGAHVARRLGLEQDACALWGIGIAIVAYATIVLRAVRRFDGLTPDALDYALVSRNLLRGAGFTEDAVVVHPGLLDAIRHPPELHGLLTPFLVAPLFAAFGEHASLVVAPSVVFAAATIGVAAVLARTLFGNAAAFLVALILLSRSDLLVWAVLGSDDVGFAFLATLALLLAVLSVHGCRRRLLFAAGVVAALATLQKFTGVILPAVLGVSVLAARPRAPFSRRETALCLGGPVLVAVALHVLRNLLSRGTVSFAFTGLDWLGRDHAPAYLALYLDVPRAPEVLAQLGFERVTALVAAQIRALCDILWTDSLVAIGGPVALVLHWRRQRSFAAGGLACFAALVPVVCLGYHVEPRYLSPLLPLHAVAIGGVLSSVAARMPRRWFDAATAVVAALALVVLVRTDRLLSRIPASSGTLPCDRALAFLRDSDPAGPILTSNPWAVSWELDRGAVQAPSNGPQAIVTVARHYGTSWALVGMPAVLGVDLGAALARGPARRALSARSVFRDEGCEVYRLGGVPPASPAAETMSTRLSQNDQKFSRPRN